MRKKHTKPRFCDHFTVGEIYPIEVSFWELDDFGIEVRVEREILAQYRGYFGGYPFWRQRDTVPLPPEFDDFCWWPDPGFFN